MPLFDWFKKKKPRDPAIEALIAELKAADYFIYAVPEKVPALKDEMKLRSYPFPFDSGREFLADAEDLAEGGVAEFLNEIGLFLRRQGVQISKATKDEMHEEGEEGVTGVRRELPPRPPAAAQSGTMFSRPRIQCLEVSGQLS